MKKSSKRTKTARKSRSPKAPVVPILKLKNGTKVKFKTTSRWHTRAKTVTVLAFVPRGQSVATRFANDTAFHGVAKASTLNDRYVVQDGEGTITTPRAATLARFTAKASRKAA